MNTKRVKFQGHEVLAPYRYLIHVDTARRVLRMARRALDMGLLDYVRCHPEHALFVRAHPLLKSVQDEVKWLKAMRPRKRESVQPTGPLLAWDAFLKPQYSDLNAVRHPELCFWVRDTTHRRFGEQWGGIHRSCWSAACGATKSCTTGRCGTPLRKSISSIRGTT